MFDRAFSSSMRRRKYVCFEGGSIIVVGCEYFYWYFQFKINGLTEVALVVVCAFTLKLVRSRFAPMRIQSLLSPLFSHFLKSIVSKGQIDTRQE
jgi:hypothetical protein